MKKCGYVALVGNTNAGKSTLLNKLVGQKISIVSPKKQTTRDNIIGILTSGNTQIVFVDTPGIHKSKTLLDKSMNKQIRTATESVDLVLYLTDSVKSVSEEQISYLSKLKEKEIPIVVLLTKIDISNKERIYSAMESLKELNLDIIPISTFRNKNLDILLSKIEDFLPECENFIYDEDELTDKSVKFISKEIIREKMLYLLEDEIPHGIAIDITLFDEESGEIHADIICEKASHKGIIIGKGGLMLKEIGTRARKDIEKLIGRKVNLKLFVKVEENWRNKNLFNN